jgi:transposase
MSLDIAKRAQIVTLKTWTNKIAKEIAFLTDVSIPTVYNVCARAIQSGFNPQDGIYCTVITDDLARDSSRSGRPAKQTDSTKDMVISKVRRDRFGREKSCTDLAGEPSTPSHSGINVSATTICRILKAARFNKTKPTRKLRLTKKMKAERLAWCRQFEHWTLTDWKNVIWSDETSLILLHRPGGYRFWRTPNETLIQSYNRERLKNASEFIFGVCFSYNKKGPCH